MRKLMISPDLTLPLEALTQRFAFLGRTGSGKSYNGGVLFEEFVQAKQQAVAVDPNGAWYGIRSSLDGKGPGLPVTIFGGEHADLPLDPSAGALVADLIIGEGISAIIDMSLFDTDSDEIKFMTAFADRLFRKNRRPMHLFVDEADTFAPEAPLGSENVMLNRMARLAKRGRGRGIGLSLLSQRSAALSKRVLSQTEVMVALQTTDPRDRRAIKGWIEGKGTLEEQEMVLSTLASLKLGEAWVWSPAFLNLLKRVRFREKWTYDSGATPKIGKRRCPLKVLAQVDLERLKRHMAETIEKARQEDPKLLRAEVIKLRAELVGAKAGVAKIAPVLPAQPVSPPKTRPALAAGEVRRLSALLGRVQRVAHEQRDAARALSEALSKAATALSAARTPDPRSLALPPRAQSRLSTPLPAPPRASHQPSNSGNGSPLDKPARAILSVLAQYSEGCLIGKLTLLAGYRLSGGFRNSLSGLRSRGLITGPNTGTMRITHEGLATIGDAYTPLPDGRALAQYWLSHPSFGQCDRKVLSALLERPQGLGMEDLAQASGYGLSGGFRNALSNLRTAGVLIGKNTETMKPSAELLG